MVHKKLIRLFLLLSLLCFSFTPPARSAAAQSAGVTAFDLIIAMNTVRVSSGLPALVEDSIINAVAQSTAEIMAANQMSWHIGDVSGRVASAGYGGGSKVWATENFAVGSSGFGIDQIMLAWSDASHMIPALNPAYCNVGAGVATSSTGMTYYVLQAAYTANKACGEYKSPLVTQPGGSVAATPAFSGVSQVIIPVEIATPDAEGRVFHVVKAGQSFWSIAVTYKITIKDIETWNNISQSSGLQIGQRLFIPGSNTAGYATPTPVGMVQISPPDADGKIVHTVATYQTLTTISQAYGVTINTILSLNGIQEDWPLQVGQKLVISAGRVTPSPTLRPLTPIEKLTPAADGRYYHEVQSGQTLSWIAQLYQVELNALMAWNGMDASAIIRPGQKLLLQVTPPATLTPTPGPATATPTATLPPPTATAAPTRQAPSPTPTPTPAAFLAGGSAGWLVPAGSAGLVLVSAWLFVRRKRQR